MKENLVVNGSPELVASVDGLVTKLLLNTKDLVELGKALGTGRSTSLDLSGTESNDDVGDGHVLGLTRTVRDHDAPAGSVRVLGGLDGLGESADLVDLEEKGVAGLLLDGSLDALGVSHSQVITDNLEVGGLEEVGPSLPVILSEGVLDRDDRILLRQFLVKVGQLNVAQPLGGVGVRVLHKVRHMHVDGEMV